GSPAIARCSARLMASTMHSVFCSAMVASLRGSAAGHQLVALATIAIRQPLVEMIESRAGVLVRHRTEALDRRIDLIAQFLLQLLLALLVPQALAVEEALQAPDGFALPGLGQLIGAAVPAGIIRGGMVTQAVGHALHQHRPLAGAGTLDGIDQPVVDSQYVVAVHL